MFGALFRRKRPEAQKPPPPAIQPGPVLSVEYEAPTVARDIRDTLLIKEGDLFLLTDPIGNVPPGDPNGLGLYYQDTRHLSAYEFVVQGLPLTVLVSTGERGFSGTQELTNPDFRTDDGELIEKQTINIRRLRSIGETVGEMISFENFNPRPVRFEVTLTLDADFRDIFEIRGIVEREHGVLVPPETAPDRRALTFRYVGRDGVQRQTYVRFDPPPTELGTGRATYRIELPGRGRVELRLEIGVGAERPPEAELARLDELIEEHEQIYGHWLADRAQIATDNRFFDAIVGQAVRDLRLLQGGEGADWYIAAGIPWYATLFGRDSLITALQALPLDPRLARSVLLLLARYQGSREDPWRDEEPGKIMHELRRGELARLNLVPFTPYYGTVDATPLFIMLAAAYYAWTADLDLIRGLEPNLRRALSWIDTYGDLDGDGFVEYARKAERGLANQGWKDSGVAVMHQDGRLADPPIALVEVQGYVYAAKRDAARLYRALGDARQADRLESEANELSARFNRAFWVEEQGFYCLALDGRKHRAEVISSNPGHCLWTGIVPPGRAGAVARRLMAPDMFSGWGIRTLGAREARYNPMGYHLGTVWPHDNSLIGLGFKRYGEHDLLIKLASGLYRAILNFPYYRIPELFCGFPRTEYGVPIRYPVACSPQAWSSGSILQLVEAMLGLEPDAPAGVLRIVQPVLPDWLNRLSVRRLRVGAAEVDLEFTRRREGTRAEAEVRQGSVRVEVV